MIIPPPPTSHEIIYVCFYYLNYLSKGLVVNTPGSTGQFRNGIVFFFLGFLVFYNEQCFY
jgi:hypothetical protein